MAETGNAMVDGMPEIARVSGVLGLDRLRSR